MALEINELTKTFEKVKVIKGISMTMDRGVYGLVGVNGAGKTTFMRMICTLLKPTTGSITWDGKDIFQLEGEYRKILGYLPQDFGYYPDFTVYDYLMYIGSIKGLRPITVKKKMNDLLEQVGLTKSKNVKMKKLSGGMKRRVGIAQALLNDPKILILDEPTAGLDPNERIRFRNLMSEISEDRVVLLSTHIVSDIEYIANQVLLMKEGCIALSGTSKELIASMTGKVWSLQVSKQEMGHYVENYKIVNVKTVANGAELRMITKGCPHQEAKEEIPTLEDAFLYYSGEKAGVQDGEI